MLDVGIELSKYGNLLDKKPLLGFGKLKWK